jgi:hypothetical protein
VQNFFNLQNFACYYNHISIYLLILRTSQANKYTSLHACIKLVQETNVFHDPSFRFISVRYLTAHSTSRLRTVGWQDDECWFGKISEGNATALIEVLSGNFPRGTEDIHDIAQVIERSTPEHRCTALPQDHPVRRRKLKSTTIFRNVKPCSLVEIYWPHFQMEE